MKLSAKQDVRTGPRRSRIQEHTVCFAPKLPRTRRERLSVARHELLPDSAVGAISEARRVDAGIHTQDCGHTDSCACVSLGTARSRMCGTKASPPSAGDGGWRFAIRPTLAINDDMIIASAQINLDVPGDWPRDILAHLDRHHDLFLSWETRSGNRSAAEYDLAVCGLEAVLRRYALLGWHCARLTDDEIANIKSGGMQMPNVAFLHQRIDALASAGLLSKKVADRLKAEHQADDEGRTGILWFCFYPPRLAEESGIERFFRRWGGEALYNSHEDDPETGAAIAGIGRPCVIEAIVPIASLGCQGFLPVKVARRYLVSRGLQTSEPVEHEGAIMRPLPAENIRRLVCFPSSEFVTLTGCDEWIDPIVA